MQMLMKKYIIKVNGVKKTQPMELSLAQNHLKQLTESDRLVAEIVPVEDSGKEILFG